MRIENSISLEDVDDVAFEDFTVLLAFVHFINREIRLVCHFDSIRVNSSRLQRIQMEFELICYEFDLTPKMTFQFMVWTCTVFDMADDFV